MKTFMAKAEEVEAKWHHVDAQDVVLGHLASKVALILQGKHKPTYTPHVLCGDFVVVTNAGKIRLTGQKAEKKKVRWHTGWIGGLKEVSVAELLEKHPDRVIKLAVKRMLPKSKLGRRMMSRLKVYAQAEHPHEAQMPDPLEI